MSLLIANALGFLDNAYGPLKGGMKSRRLGDAGGTDGAISDEAVRDAKASGLSALSITVAVDPDPEVVEQEMDAYDAAIAKHSDTFVKALSAADIHRAKSEGKIALIWNFQDSAMVGTDLSRVDHYYKRGVRVFQLTYNGTNTVGHGSRMPEDLGLTEFGRTYVEKVNSLNAIVDMSHSNRQTCLDAIALSKAPPMISHTGCRALVDLPRNKSDAEMRAVAERGGFVGMLYICFIAPHRRFTSEDLADHMVHAVNICGEDHVGFGSDTGVADIPDMEAQWAFYREMFAARTASGVGADGEHPDFLPFPDDMIGPDQFRVMIRALEGRGFTESRIEKIMGRNFVDYAARVWGA